MCKQVEEASESVSVDSLNCLLNDTVNVVWEWEWDENLDHGQDSDNSDGHPADPTSDHINNYLHSSSEESDAESDDANSKIPSVTRVVTFKCIGTTYDSHAQEILCKVSHMLQKNEKVEVNSTVALAWVERMKRHHVYIYA